MAELRQNYVEMMNIRIRLHELETQSDNGWGDVASMQDEWDSLWIRWKGITRVCRWNVDKSLKVCRRGHPFTAENTMKQPSGKKCRICWRDWRRSTNA